MRSFGVAVLFVALAGTLASCLRAPSVRPQLPDGMQEKRGIVRSAPLSLSRRGTHVLSVSGANVVYLESISIDLSAYQGADVTVRGSMIANADERDLPVLLVETMTVMQSAETEWILSDFGVSFSTPSSWTKNLSGSTVAFIDVSGREALSIRSVESAASPFSNAAQALPDSESQRIVVASRKAIREMSRDGTSERVWIDRGKSTNGSSDVLLLEFKATETRSLREVVIDVLHSLAIEDAHSSAIATESAQSSASASILPSGRKPCGGTAGILCPQGQFCDILHVSDDTGFCRSQ